MKVSRNTNIAKLQTGYLFPEVGIGTYYYCSYVVTISLISRDRLLELVRTNTTLSAFLITAAIKMLTTIGIMALVTCQVLIVAIPSLLAAHYVQVDLIFGPFLFNIYLYLSPSMNFNVNTFCFSMKEILFSPSKGDKKGLME